MRDIEDYTKNYLIDNFEDYQVKYRKKKIKEILKKYKPQNLLEIGCGMVPIFMDYELNNGIYTIVEPSKYFYDNAVKLSEGYEGVHCINDFFGKNDASSEKLGCQFDFIICSSLLHEVDNLEEILTEITRCCNRNTVVHINVPNAFSMHRLLAQESEMITDIHQFSQRNQQFQQNTVFDLKTLKETVMKYGFDIIEEGSYFVKPFTHGQMYELIKKGIIDEEVLDGLYKMERWMPEYGSEIFVNCRIHN